MGRTNPTYRDRLRRLEERWSDYRRALRHPDGEHFDRLWTRAADHADAAGHQHDERALDLALVSMALAHERRLAALGERVDELAERVDELAERVDELADRAGADAPAGGNAPAGGADGSDPPDGG
jgi:hypothetical protein